VSSLAQGDEKTKNTNKRYGRQVGGSPPACSFVPKGATFESLCDITFCTGTTPFCSSLASQSLYILFRDQSPLVPPRGGHSEQFGSKGTRRRRIQTKGTGEQVGPYRLALLFPKVLSSIPPTVSPFALRHLHGLAVSLFGHRSRQTHAISISAQSHWFWLLFFYHIYSRGFLVWHLCPKLPAATASP